MGYAQLRGEMGLQARPLSPLWPDCEPQEKVDQGNGVKEGRQAPSSPSGTVDRQDQAPVLAAPQRGWGLRVFWWHLGGSSGPFVP